MHVQRGRWRSAHVRGATACVVLAGVIALLVAAIPATVTARADLFDELFKQGQAATAR